MSFNNQENSFEMIKKQDSKWIGLAEGENISIDVEEFISVIPAIIKHPVMLVYQIHREIPKNKFSFDENSIPITYDDKEKQRQLEEDSKYAEEFQKKINEDEEMERK